MNILIVGASGMVGQGVLQTCLNSADIAEIVLLVRHQPENIVDPRVRIIQHDDLLTFRSSDLMLREVDACFFCAGVSASGVTEQNYRRLTCDLTLHTAEQLKLHSPTLKFIYVSGLGADSSGKSSQMWARVRGEVENKLQQLLPGNVTIFRPAFIMSSPGVKSRTKLYRMMYTFLTPFMKGVSAVTGIRFLSTIDIGNAMLNIVRFGADSIIMTRREIISHADKDNHA